MKKKFFFILISILILFSCASLQESKKYSEMAEAHDFAYYFPSPTRIMTFDSIDEAYDYINSAKEKVRSSISQTRAKGLSAKLNGEMPDNDKPVTVAYFFTASTAKERIPLSEDEMFQTAFQEAVSITNVYLVFYEGRGVSISDYYLNSGYRYNSNRQYKTFKFGDVEYKAEYPTGWGIKKAFGYLKKEID